MRPGDNRYWRLKRQLRTVQDLGDDKQAAEITGELEELQRLNAEVQRTGEELEAQMLRELETGEFDGAESERVLERNRRAQAALEEALARDA